MIREALGVSIASRDDLVHLSGEADAVHAARQIIETLGEGSGRGELSRREVLNLISDIAAQAPAEGPVIFDDNGAPGSPGAPGIPDGPVVEVLDAPTWEGRLNVYANGRAIRPKSQNQAIYLEAIRDHDLVFCAGPAGTGKTYLAVAAAVHLLKAGRVKKVILARPAVEAGEKLGYLPGDMQAKVNPYLRPLMDALHDMIDYPTIKRFMLNDVVEIVPLAFMRGRTLNNAAIILDEAQNTTHGQMKMFLTRMGERSKMIVTGDTTQTDLPDPAQSGLVDAIRRLRRTPGIAFCTLEKSDIVRHQLVQRIVEAYGDEGPERR
ncbi:MAG: PhoH family protein [Phycisphaerales bacterium]|nr:MAG: PhoH family protein [Phycisphaerales bacterium]